VEVMDGFVTWHSKSGWAIGGTAEASKG
jgi:hypothetical protein